MGHFSPRIMFFDKIKHFYKIKNRQIWIFRKSNFQNRKIKIFGRKSENLVEKSTFSKMGELFSRYRVEYLVNNEKSENVIFRLFFTLIFGKKLKKIAKSPS